MPTPKDPKKLEEYRKKLSEARKGKPTWNKGLKISGDPKYKDYIDKLKARPSPNKGKPVSEQVKKKISDALKGRTKGQRLGFANGGRHSEETKKKMSASHKGKKIGPMSEAQKKKISDTTKKNYAERPDLIENLKNRNVSEETRLKISKGNKEFSETDKGKEQRLRAAKLLSERQAGSTLPESHRQAISKGNKKYFNQPHIKEELSQRSKDNWERPEFREKFAEAVNKPETKEKKSKSGKEVWNREGQRDKMSVAISKAATRSWATAERKEIMAKANQDPKSKLKKSRSQKALWQKVETREKRLPSLLLRNESPKRYKTGTHVSPKADLVRYKSGMELEFYLMLDKNDSILTYQYEPVLIHYQYKGELRTYAPDLLITYIDGSQKLVEIKPEYLLLDPQNQAKFTAAQSLYENFEIWTESDLS